MNENLARKVTEKFESKPGEVTSEASANEVAGDDLLAEIRRFFEDDIKSDLYSKENIDPSSYRVSGHPCHGGYVDEAQPGPVKREDAE